MRGLLVAAVATAAAVPATPAAADTTPSGAATLKIGYSSPRACPAYSGGPGVIVAWQADVGDGGQSGTVRPVFRDAVGDPVELPAQPGRYRFPAPHLSRDMNTCGETVGLEQATGDHAVLLRDAPADQYVNVIRAGQPDEHIDGARLAVDMIVEPDRDRDLRGDYTEDRTDLRLTANPTREADGRARVEVTVTNAGPLAADLATLTATLAGARWEGACSPVWSYPTCSTPRLAPGESRVFVLRGDLPDAVDGEVSIASEGSDLVAADDKAAVTLPAAPAFDLVAAETQRLSQGVKVQVRAVRAGRTRVTVAYKVRGKTVKVGKIVKLAPYKARSVTIKATGAKLRSLRRAAAKASLSAEVTARTFSGKTPVTAKTTVTR